MMKSCLLPLIILSLIFFVVGCETNHPSYHGQTPLIVAARHSEAYKVTTFILSGQNVNAKDHQGHTALTYAAGQGDIKIMRILIMAAADIHYDGERALVDAVMGGHREATKYLLN